LSTEKKNPFKTRSGIKRRNLWTIWRRTFRYTRRQSRHTKRWGCMENGCQKFVKKYQIIFQHQHYWSRFWSILLNYFLFKLFY